MYKRQFYQIVESNRIEKLIRQRESNRIELFTPNRNALVNTVYIEYKSVVTHSHSLTHTSADQPTSVQ